MLLIIMVKNAIPLITNTTLINLLNNYEQYERILKKTEYSYHLAELKKSLDKLYFSKTIIKSMSSVFNSLLRISFSPLGSLDFSEIYDKRISSLKLQIEQEDIPNLISGNVQNRIILIFKKIVNGENSDVTESEIVELNQEIVKATLELINNSISQKFGNTENRIKRARRFFITMTNSQIEFENIKEEYMNYEQKTDLLENIANLEKIYDKIPKLIRDIDIEMQNSKGPAFIAIFSVILSIIGILLVFKPS
jgi:hypothetical protein